jgi:hypothetical protein
MDYKLVDYLDFGEGSEKFVEIASEEETVAI